MTFLFSSDAPARALLQSAPHQSSAPTVLSRWEHSGSARPPSEGLWLTRPYGRGPLLRSHDIPRARFG